MTDNKLLEWKNPRGMILNRRRVLNSVGAGWRPMVDKLIDDLFAAGWNGDLRQIKEKFGTLRFYIGEATDFQHQLTWDAEAASDDICEACGAPGKRSTVGHGWLKTLCAEHAALGKTDPDALYEVMAGSDQETTAPKASD